MEEATMAVCRPRVSSGGDSIKVLGQEWAKLATPTVTSKVPFLTEATRLVTAGLFGRKRTKKATKTTPIKCLGVV